MIDTHVITSLQNTRIKKWTSLHDKKGRDETGLFLVEGDHLVEEALKAGCLKTVITEDVSPFAFEDTVSVTSQVMRKLSKNTSGAHIIGVCVKPALSLQSDSRLVLLDGVQDPGNLGTIIRTALSFGFDGVFCSEDTCDLFNDKVVRSTQGALFHIPVIRDDLLPVIKNLKERDVSIIATRISNAMAMDEVNAQDKMAFIFGNEGRGVSPSLQEAADEYMAIEMDGFESLNVAVAAGIIMHRYRKR